MPFIWNDERAELVEDSANFNRSEFVVARKIFVRFNEDAKDITEDWIQLKFQSYGRIEQIDLFSEPGRATWAYVTFFSDNDAHSAYTATSSLTDSGEIEKILPADTWHQPVSLASVEEKADLDDAAMKRIQEDVSRLTLSVRDDGDIDGSDLVRRILASKSEAWIESMKPQIERLARNFTFYRVDTNFASCMPLAEVRSILRTIGLYVRDLTVQFRDEKWPQNVERFYEKLCQYIGSNLKTLRVVWVRNSEDWLKHLKPLLRHIDTLYVTVNNYDFDFDIDFQAYCPNLRTLKIQMNLKGELLAKPWPALERLSIRDNQYMEERLVLELMKNNPQLKYFKVYANDCENFLQQIPEHLHNLEELCLYQAYPSISASNLIHLAEMKNLRSLKLMFLEEDELDGIIACLPKFKQLQELKIHTWYDGPDSVDADDLFQPNLDAVVNLSQELHALDCFHIRYCQISTDMIFNFIRNARKLKQFRVYRCGVEITDEILDSIDSIRQLINPTELVIYADKISSEFSEEKLYRHVRLVRK